MRHIVELASDIMVYISSFMKIGEGIQTILRFYLIDLNGCNTGITDGKKL
jgi:hypothetical protein